ncbi:MAG: phosphate/phosphite/phosphonate ABC transporter substrate-binding protein [Planctomycetota bacterium]
MPPLILGAVIYDPKVATIWDRILRHFEERHVPMDVVFYTNYELQVDALLRGFLDIAWNSPLAWVDAQRRSQGACRAIAMRDTDRDRCTHLVARAGTKALADLKGKTIAFGAKDSPQATLIPKEHLLRSGLDEGSYKTLRFDVLVGKHGDHIGGERDAFRALEKGDAAACCMLDLNWDGWTKDGTIDPSAYKIVSTTPRFDHCVFTVRKDFREEAFLKALFSMDYRIPEHREVMDMEGLKKWEAGRTTGFDLLTGACEHQRFFAVR